MTPRRPLSGAVALLGLVTPLFAAAPPPRDTEGWFRVDTAHLTIFSNAPQESAIEVGRSLERFRSFLATFAIDLEVTSPVPTFIYVFRDNGAFRPYLPRRAAASPDPALNISGYFVKHRDANYISIDASPGTDPWAIVYHEYAHYFFNNNLHDIPLWFSEGIAECLSTFGFEKGTVTLGRPLAEHVRWLKRHPLIPLADLFATDTSSPNYNEGARQGTFYAQSWAIVHFLLWGRPEATDSGVEFLRGLKRDSSLAAALRPLIGGRPDDLLERVKAYARGRLRHSEFDSGPLEDGGPARVSPMGRDEALHRLGDYLIHADPKRTADAEAHFVEAIRLNPRHAGAHAGLAQVRSQQRRHSEAFTAFERSLELDEADPHVPLLFAYALLDKAFPGGITRRAVTATTPPELARAREMFERSTRSHPRIGEAWAGLGSTYAFDAGDLTAGIEALERARQLLPAREDVVLNLAILLARGGHRARAESLVDSVLARSADPDFRAAGGEVLFRGDMEEAVLLIRDGKVEEGLSRLESLRDRSGDAGLRAEVEAQIRAVEENRAANRVVAEFNAAVERANRGDFAGAIALLEGLIPRIADSQLEKDAGRTLTRLRQVWLFNQAAERSNKGDLRGAIPLLERLLQDPLDAELEKRARDLLSRIRSALRQQR